MKSAVYLSELFPKAKFILMTRDPRATVISQHKHMTVIVLDYLMHFVFRFIQSSRAK